jgi:rhodanese-related sulfurtransferase
MTAVAAAQSISPKQVQDKISAGGNFVLIDIRDQASFSARTITGAIHLNWDGAKITDGFGDKIGGSAREVIIFCQNGVESKKAADFLKLQGYTNVSYIQGGMAAYLNSLNAPQTNPTTWGVIKALFGSNFRQKTS